MLVPSQRSWFTERVGKAAMHLTCVNSTHSDMHPLLEVRVCL